MTEKEVFIEKMKMRTKQFVLDVIKLYQSMPNKGEFWVVGKQLLRSASSVGANYRASCRARSVREFFSKMSIVVEEADESSFWLEVLIESNMINNPDTKRLLSESNEFTKIFSKSRKSVGEKIKKNKY